MINVLYKSIEPFFKIFQKASKIANCSKFFMEVIFRKRLVFEIKKTQTSKTFTASKYNLNTHFGVIWSNFIKIVFFFQSI